MLKILIGVLIVLCCSGVIAFTLLLNSKSEGLGAAVTGASDSYRGAIGPEEQKRQWLRNFAIGFIGLSFLFTVFETYGLIGS
jgi:preprotein translocase subunit SecG